MKLYTVGALALPLAVHAQSLSCSALRPSGSIQPSVASGYHLQVVATGLSGPRGILLDNAGHLLVVESDTGTISQHTINDDNGCVTLSNARNVTEPTNLNHGIQLSSDGNTLYASNASTVMRWAYDAAEGSVGDEEILVTNMSTSGHQTRTLQLSSFAPGVLLVSHGSGPNRDLEAARNDTGISTLKAFNLDARRDGPFDYVNDGDLLGWGLRNSVGVAEHPVTGGIYTVENSADNIGRDGEQVSENNPGEEMNYHGILGEAALQGENYGYPWCYAVWAVDQLPNSGNLSVGTQFAVEEYPELNNQNQTDQYCSEQTAPRITFQAHMAPLDIKFNDSGSEGWITFRGSWNREDPIGYKVSIVEFEDGEPTEPPSSTTAALDVVKNADDSVCPDDCFRPVAMAIDPQGRVYFSSDASNEIYLITRTSDTPDLTSSGSPESTSATPPSAASTSLGSLPKVIAQLLITSTLVGLFF